MRAYLLKKGVKGAEFLDFDNRYARAWGGELNFFGEDIGFFDLTEFAGMPLGGSISSQDVNNKAFLYRNAFG